MITTILTLSLLLILFLLRTKFNDRKAKSREVKDRINLVNEQMHNECVALILAIRRSKDNNELVMCERMLEDYAVTYDRNKEGRNNVDGMKKFIAEKRISLLINMVFTGDEQQGYSYGTR